MNLFIWRRLQHWPQRPEGIDERGYERIIENLTPYYRNKYALQAGFEKWEIGNIASETGLTPDEIALVLAGSLKETGGQLTQSWISKHWPDLLVVAALAFLIALPVLGWKAEEKKKLEMISSQKEPRIVAIRDLPAYVPLTSNALRGENFKTDKDATQGIEEFVGRYPTELIDAGSTIDSNALSKKKVVLSNHSILRVSLKSAAYGKVPFLPFPATLLFSARNTPATGEVFSIWLLKLDDGPTATIGIPDAQVPKLAKWIGNSDAYLVFLTTNAR